MKQILRTLVAGSLLSLSSVTFAASYETYEVPEKIKTQNETAFYDDSLKYEDALRNMQIVFVIDKSGSQGGVDKYPHGGKTPKGMLSGGLFGTNWSQWDNTYMVTKYLAEAMLEYDKDSKIPLFFFGSSVQEVVATDVGSMLTSFKANTPGGSTNLHGALKLAFQKYAAADSKETTIFVVLTDGEPDQSKVDIEKLIKTDLAAKDPSAQKLKLLFIRIGDSSGAKKFLQEMDDSSEIGKWVDTKSDDMVYKMGPKNLILNAIFEHLDSKYPE